MLQPSQIESDARVDSADNTIVSQPHLTLQTLRKSLDLADWSRKGIEAAATRSLDRMWVRWPMHRRVVVL